MELHWTDVALFVGFIGFVVAFSMYGFFVKRAPAAAAVTGLLLNPIVYGAFYALNATEVLPIAFLNRIAITFIILVLVMAVITWLRPLEHARQMPINEDFDMTTSPVVRWIGITIILITVGLYVVFW